MGEVALKERSFRGALGHFRRAAERAPSSALAHTKRGEVAELLGEFDESLEGYDTAARLAPSAARFFRVGALADRMGNTPMAVEWFTASLASRPASRSDPKVELLKQFLFGFRVSRGDVAERLFQVYVESGDRDGALKLARSEGWVREGADYCDGSAERIPDKTKALLAMLLHPQTADCLLPVGMKLTQGGLVRMARLVLMDRIRNSVDPQVRAKAEAFLRTRLPAHDVAKLAESLNVVGYNLHYRFKKREEAVEVYGRAIAADPAFSWPYSNTANVLADRGEIDRAIEWYRKALAINPNHWNTLINMGWTLFSARRYGEALVIFRQAVAKDPGEARGHSNLGRVLLNLGQEDEGIQELQTAVRLNPRNREDRELLNRRVQAKAQHGQTPSSLR